MDHALAVRDRHALAHLAEHLQQPQQPVRQAAAFVRVPGGPFAPELGNVYKRRGPEFIKNWIKSQPTGIPGRRQMPQSNLSDEELDAVVEFLRWVSEIDTITWPPNIEG